MTKTLVTVDWPAVPGAPGYDLDTDGHKSTSKKPTSRFGIGQGSHIRIAAQQPKLPPIGMPTLDAFRVSLQPNNSEGAGNHYTAAWTAWNSPRTPRKAPNGVDPAARYLGIGERWYIVKAYRMVQGFTGRWLNFHPVAGDLGWNGPSSAAFDKRQQPGHSGAQAEIDLECERIQDSDDEPHSGGAHYAMPKSSVAPGLWRWFAIDIAFGSNEDGALKVYDWETGALLLGVSGVNTLRPGAKVAQLWEGGYESSGLSTLAIEDQTPGLFSAAGFADCLTDKPVLAARWGTKSTVGGPDSSIDIGFARIPVPPSPMAVTT